MTTDFDPAPAPPAPAPTPAPAAPAPAPLKPGYRTTEAWCTFFTIVVGAIPASGLIDNAPIAAKIVGLVIGALSTLNFTTQRTALKRAHLASIGAPQAAKSSKLVMLVAVVLAMAAIGSLTLSCVSRADCALPKNAHSAQCVVENAIVDCTGLTTLPTAVAVAAPAVDTLITSAKQADGSIKWSTIETSLVDLALKYGPCVIAQIWNDYMTGRSAAIAAAGSGSGSGSGSSSAAVAAGSGSTTPVTKASRPAPEFSAEWDRIRAKVAPGRHFKTSGGTL